MQGITVNKYAVSIVSRLDPTELVAPHQQRSNSSSCSDDALVRSKTKQLDEMLKITRICSVRRPRKAVITVEVNTVIEEEQRSGLPSR